MRTRFPAAILLLPILLLGACTEAAPPAGPQEGSVPGIAASQHPTDEQGIRELIAELFPPPGLQRAALKQFRNIVRQRDRGQLDDAVSKALNLVQFTLARLEVGQLMEPSEGTVEQGVANLIAGLLEFVGLDAPDIDPGILDGSTDGVIALAFNDQDNNIVTQGTGRAGVFIPEGAISEDDEGAAILVVIQEVGTPCLASGNGPFPFQEVDHCYSFERFPPGDFVLDITGAVCLDFLGDEAQLHAGDPAEPVDEVAVPASLIQAGFRCPPRGVGVNGNGALRVDPDAWGGLGRLANLLLYPARALVNPPHAWAANLGLGGTRGSFSNWGWAIPRDLEAVSDADETADAGDILVRTVRVTNRHPEPGEEEEPEGAEGIQVTFTITDGDGVFVDGSGEPILDENEEPVTTLTVQTDENGEASVSWQIGVGVNELTVTAAFAAGTVTFTATGQPVIVVA